MSTCENCKYFATCGDEERTEPCNGKATVCPQCGKELTIDDYETSYDPYEGDTYYYIVCSECGFDERNEMYEGYNGDDDDYTPSATMGDYSPSNPWDAPGMSIRDFI